MNSTHANLKVQALAQNASNYMKEEPARLPEVSVQMDYMDNALHAIDEISSLLEEKLGVILRIEGEKPTSHPIGIAKPPTSTGLGSRLAEMVSRLEATNNRLNSIISRAEV